MALIDVVCVQCAAQSEVSRPAAEWPRTPPCPSCGGATEQIHLPKGYSFTGDPLVVYQAPDGSYRFPGDVNGPATQKYEQMRYTRLEARSFAEVRALERAISQRDEIAAAPIRERLQARREEQSHKRRSELFHRMASMSPQVRDLARVVIEKNNRKPSRKTAGATYSEAYN